MLRCYGAGYRIHSFLVSERKRERERNIWQMSWQSNTGFSVLYNNPPFIAHIIVFFHSFCGGWAMHCTITYRYILQIDVHNILYVLCVILTHCFIFSRIAQGFRFLLWMKPSLHTYVKVQLSTVFYTYTIFSSDFFSLL